MDVGFKTVTPVDDPFDVIESLEISKKQMLKRLLELEVHQEGWALFYGKFECFKGNEEEEKSEIWTYHSNS